MQVLPTLETLSRSLHDAILNIAGLTTTEVKNRRSIGALRRLAKDAGQDARLWSDQVIALTPRTNYPGCSAFAALLLRSTSITVLAVDILESPFANGAKSITPPR